MGGHLLHIWNLPEKRVSRVDFERIILQVLDKLRARFNLRRIEPLKFFTDKADFGDLDIAFETFSNQSVQINFIEEFEKLFGYKPHKNGNCISFPVEGFQVDILMFSDVVFDIAQVYYAYESGNFMGRIADKMGLSYGHRGLYLQIPLSYFDSTLPDHQYRDILLSRSPRPIFESLGFDYERFNQSFKNFEEMSQWVAESKYFSPEVFAFESLNSINRTRNRKRPVYAKFVDWCAQQPARNILPSKESVRDTIISSCPIIRKQIDEITIELQKNAIRRAKFNGNLIKELRGLEGAELGKFIVDFKKKYGSFETWLDDNSADQVKKAILCHQL